MSDAQSQAVPGRPKLSASERRSARVVTMVTENEYASLQLCAKRSGKSLSALCHDLLVKAVATQPPDTFGNRKIRQTKEK